jgi:hypothetical protein
MAGVEEELPMVGCVWKNIFNYHVMEYNRMGGSASLKVVSFYIVFSFLHSFFPSRHMRHGNIYVLCVSGFFCMIYIDSNRRDSRI